MVSTIERPHCIAVGTEILYANHLVDKILPTDDTKGSVHSASMTVTCFGLSQLATHITAIGQSDHL